ncbi:hypothetical protein MRX96_025873 [Rhipicephalus microplus]
MAFHKIGRCQHHTKKKKSGPRNAKCMAKVDVKIKLVTFDTKRRDKYLQREVPLSAVIRIDDRHSHSTDSADALRLLRGTRSTRQTFLCYFSEGMTPSEARRLHESKLSMEDDGPAKLANAALSPPQRTVCHWHSVWREACFDGTHIDPVLKLEEKASLYAAQGAHISVTRGGSSACWAEVVVTPIMRRAEWRRPTTSHNSVDKDQRRRFMSAFQLVMYADTAEKLEAATAELKALQHEASVSRVRRFLRRQEEWVQLYHLDVLTRGHNTNNFEEATIRVLKDIILNRVEDLTQSHSQARWLWCGRNTLKAVSSATPTALLQPINCSTSCCCRECQKTQPRPSKCWPLSEKCPPRIFFEPFQEEAPSSSARTTEGTSAQQEEPKELQAMQGSTSTQEATHVAPVPSVPDVRPTCPVRPRDSSTPVKKEPCETPMAMEQLPLSSSGIQSTSSEALQAGLSEPGEEASGGGIEPASPRSTAEPLPLRRSTRARKPPDRF